MWTLYNVPRLAAELDPKRIAAVREKYAQRRIVVYVGGVNEMKGLDVALEAVAKVREDLREALLVLIGTPRAASAQSLNRLDRAIASGWAEMISWLPYEKMLEYLTCARVGLALHQPGIPYYDLVSRGTGRKFFTYMQAGLPIVGPDFAEVGRVVLEEGCGILVDTTDREAVAGAIRKLLLDPERAAELGRRGRAAIESRYNWEREQAKLIAAYVSLEDCSKSAPFSH